MVSPVSCREGSPSSCAVQEVKVLPECQYKSKMGYAHDLKPYWGHKEVGVIARDNRQLSMAFPVRWCGLTSSLWWIVAQSQSKEL